MDFEVADSTSDFESANDNLNVDSAPDIEIDESVSGKEKRYKARRKIEDRVEYKKMRDELGWMDDFTTEFGEIY